MALATVFSRAQNGLDAPEVRVEVHLANGLPGLSIVGLPQAAVRESKDRVRSAIQNSRFEFPTRRITVNLSPADLRKEGGRFDLPIAIGILAASGQLPESSLADLEFTAELSLTGALRPISGVLPVALAAASSGRSLIVANENADEAALAGRADVRAASHLLDVCAHLFSARQLPTVVSGSVAQSREHRDLRDVRGQPTAKRALEIAAAGGHGLLMIGPPGTGKSMLARRLPGILPPLTEDEAVETASIASISSGGFAARTWRKRPFRSPHHTASAVALVGGGRPPRPGEISLAHNGVLFLDELPEFSRHVLEVLREPLETGSITVSRAAHQAEFPTRFQLIAAMNPCPCGFLGDESGRCNCPPDVVGRYRARVSGPFMDRIDMHVEVGRPPPEVAVNNCAEVGEPSAAVAQRVIAARDLQINRQQVLNALLTPSQLDECCRLDEEARQLLKTATSRFALSMRGVHRILKLSRTIADLEGANICTERHVAEAISLRCADRSGTATIP